MNLSIIDPTHLRLDVDGAPELALNTAFNPLSMLAASLALCTAAVIHDYAATAQFVAVPFAIDIHWRYADWPRRVAEFDLRLLVGPHVPPSRHAALVRATEHCTVHQTLAHGVPVHTTLEVERAQQA